MNKLISAGLLILHCYLLSYGENWTSTELTLIQWGSGESQLEFYPGGPVGPPGSFEEPAMGPHLALVDSAENIVICSFQLGQLKIFDNNGDLISDLSRTSPNYNSDIFYENPANIFLDSLCHMIIQSDPGTPFAPEVDYSGNILDRIRPFYQDTAAYIQYMNWSPTGTMFFFNRDYGWVTYSEGVSTPGGSTGFLATNGSFYAVTKKSANSLQFKKFENPDSTTLAETRDSTEIAVAVDTLVAAGLTNGGDGDNLYVMMFINNYITREIWQFDLDYNILDKLILPPDSTYQGLGIVPFIRHDGNIYEFRTREDGLHVIRWTKP
jgi:hypothetical protein